MAPQMPKIMVVDDDMTMQILLCECLSSLDYNVVGTAETGQEAIELAGQLKLDLILFKEINLGSSESESLSICC